jgi:hypothetical protein
MVVVISLLGRGGGGREEGDPKAEIVREPFGS